jgi:hypothetical protein
VERSLVCPNNPDFYAGSRGQTKSSPWSSRLRFWAKEIITITIITIIIIIIIIYPFEHVHRISGDSHNKLQLFLWSSVSCEWLA